MSAARSRESGELSSSLLGDLDAEPKLRLAETRPGLGRRDGRSPSVTIVIPTLNEAENPLFVNALVDGAEYVKGSRFLPGAGTADMTRLRRAGNWGFVQLVRYLFGARYTDLCYGYNAFWRDAAPLLDVDADGFEIETMMNIRAVKVGLRVVEVPSYEHARFHGTGRLRTFPDGWRVMKTIFKETLRSTKRAPHSGHAALSVRDDPAGDLAAAEA